MKQVISIAVPVVILSVCSAFAQAGRTNGAFQYVPRDSSKTVWDVGTGLGVPYGIFGGKVSLGTSLITGDIGLGLLPFAWEPGVSVSGAVHFGSQYAAVRPKLTLAYSNIVAASLLLEEDSVDALYEETFSGIGIYGGMDWRLDKTSPFCIDLNIGWVFPFVGNSEIRERYDRAKADLRSQGYSLTGAEHLSLDRPKVSLGITYAPQRSLKLWYPH